MGTKVTNVERIYGSIFRDKLVGDSGDNTIFGSNGHDLIQGGAGNDTLYGGVAYEWRAIWDNGTVLDYNGNYDTIEGGAGDDEIYAKINDGAWGGAGNDKIKIDGGDLIDGGDGTDEYYIIGNKATDPVVKITNHQDADLIRICLGSGQAASETAATDGQIYWTTEIRNVYDLGKTEINDVVFTVFLKQDGAGVQQAVIAVIDRTTTTGKKIAWSDPNAAAGTGCNFLPTNPDLGTTNYGSNYPRPASVGPEGRVGGACD